MNKKGIGILTITALLFAALFGIKNKDVYAANGPNGYETPSVSYSEMANCPSNYYSSVEGLKGDSLLEKVAKITLDNHRYYTTYGQLRGGSCYSDADSNDPNNKIIDFYTGWSIDNDWITSQNSADYSRDKCWEREHVWCKSLFSDYEGGTSIQTTGPGSDIHHLRPEIGTINGHRSNAKFANVKNMSDGEEYYYVNPNTNKSEFTGCYSVGSTYFEPRDSNKGDVARILMYLYTHYSMDISANASHEYRGNFPITNIVYTSTGTSQSAWNLLMDWNELDPVDTFEMNRNNYCASVTGTRNPYIDHPEYARMIWDASYSGSGASGGIGGEVEDNPSSSETSTSESSSSSSSTSSINSSSITTSEENSSSENLSSYETTYTIESVSTISQSGTVLEGVSATFNSTYTSKYQLTSGNSATLNVSNLAGYKVSKIILSMKSNSSKGSGSLMITSGGTTLKEIEACGFNSSSWNGAWSTEYVDIVVDDLVSHTINNGEDLKIVIAATANSLYIQKYTIFYEKVGENDNTPTLNSLQQIIEKYYNNGVYTKKTNINLSEYAIEDIQEYFHGIVDLDRTTYYKGNALLMGDLDGGFANINSGYGTDASGNMTHFTWNQKTQETEIDYTVTKGEHQTWKDRDIDGMEGFYVTLNDMLQVGYFDDWTENKYSVTNTNDAYFIDFLAFVAPCLYSSIVSTNFVTINELIISEETHETYGDYLCFQITLDTTSKGVADNEELILAESRVYMGNVIFDENETTNELESTTITRTIASLASENGWSNSLAYRENIALDNIVTINTSTSGNTAKYYTSDNTWRFYASNESTLTISVPTGYQISSVSITYTGGSLAVNDSTYLSDSNVIVEGKAITFQASSGTVKISSISVTYIKL